MTVSTTSSARITLADSLLKEGLISHEQYEAAIQEYERNKRSLIGILTDMGALNEQKRMEFLQKRTQCDVVRLKDVVPSADVVGFVNRETCRRNRMVPLRMDTNRVLVAMEDPTDVRVIGDLEKIFGKNIKAVLAPSKEIAETIERLPERAGPDDDAPVVHGTGYKVVSSISLLVIALGPMALSYFVAFQTERGQEWYGSYGFETFETMLVLLISWGSWASIAYFLNDLIFGD